MRIEGRFVSRRKAIKFLKVSRITGCTFEKRGRWWVVINPNAMPRDDVASANVRSVQPKVELIKGTDKRARKQPPKLTRSSKGKHVYSRGTGVPIEMHFDGKGMHYLVG
jgi:hypothetical protein